MPAELIAKPGRILRWYRYGIWALLIFVLLPADAILWYPIIHPLIHIRKGYAVLTVIVIIGIAIFYLLVRLVLALLKKAPFQFSLRSLLLFTAIVAIAFSWLGTEMRRASKQKEAIAALHDHNGMEEKVASDYIGGTVSYTEEYYDDRGGFAFSRQPAAPAWLENLLGADFFDTADIVTLVVPKITDADLENIKDIGNLSILRLTKTQVTDDGLNNLQKALPNLSINRHFNE